MYLREYTALCMILQNEKTAEGSSSRASDLQVAILYPSGFPDKEMNGQ